MVKRELLVNIIVMGVTCAVLAVTGLILLPQFMERKPVVIPTGPVHLTDGQRYARGGHKFGAANGAVTIVEFSDFQCPFCAKFTDSVHAILSRRTDVSVVFHHFPLSIHPFAEAAAGASECAARQGDFPAYHDILFADRDSMGLMSWAAYGAKANIPDTTALSNCVRSGVMKDIVDADIALGRQAGVVVTPTVIINDTKYNGVPIGLDSIINKAAVSAINRPGIAGGSQS